MSDAARDQVWRHSHHRNATFLVALALADVANDMHDNLLFMKIDSLATKTRLSKSTVSESLRELEADGWLIRVADGVGRGKATVYQWQFFDDLPVIFETKSAYRKHPKSVPFTESIQISGEKIRKSDALPKDTYSLITKDNGREIQDLMKLYFDNFIGDIQPARGQMAGQLQIVLKETTYEKLIPLIRLLAVEGQPVSKGTLMIAAKKLREPNQAPTPVPQPYRETEMANPNAVPMPDEVRELLRKGIGKPVEGD